MIRKRQRVLDPTNLLDAMIGMSGVAVIAWVLIVVPYLTNTSAPTGARATEAVFSVFAFVLAAMVARLAIGPGARNTAYYLLAVSGYSLLGLEVIFALELGLGREVPGHSTWIIIINFACFLAFGAATVHPSMAQLAEPATEPVASMTRRRLFVMTAAVLTPPVVLGLRSATGLETAAIIGCWGAISVMVMLRVAGLVRARERAQSLERTLSRAAAGLVAATEGEQMHNTALQAALQITSKNARASILVTTNGRWNVAASLTDDGSLPRREPHRSCSAT